MYTLFKTLFKTAALLTHAHTHPLTTAGFIELARYKSVRANGLLQKFAMAYAANPKVVPTDAAFTVPMSVWWQVVPHFLEGASETFTNVAVLEIFFTQVRVVCVCVCAVCCV